MIESDEVNSRNCPRVIVTDQTYGKPSANDFDIRDEDLMAGKIQRDGHWNLTWK